MGQLIYGVAPAVEIDDKALEHLQAVIITKLRRNESFSFSWDDEPDVGGDAGELRPGTIWISQSSALFFRFDGPRGRTLNKRWLLALAAAANGSGGLRMLPEPV
ncbi:hypothetical protein [Microbacterium sp. 18062]|uniref:DUF7882 family protein n=1 Tax=Microbacterium sp. 18062 TaxID=2681410 RepID=UPI00135B3E73|nr:hypothetical protein [Microbacterium sp. 18062]